MSLCPKIGSAWSDGFDFWVSVEPFGTGTAAPPARMVHGVKMTENRTISILDAVSQQSPLKKQLDANKSSVWSICIQLVI